MGLFLEVHFREFRVATPTTVPSGHEKNDVNPIYNPITDGKPWNVDGIIRIAVSDIASNVIKICIHISLVLLLPHYSNFLKFVA